MDQSLFGRMIDCLLPNMHDHQDRKALISRAIRNRQSYEQIDWKGSAEIFTTRPVDLLGPSADDLIVVLETLVAEREAEHAG
jgi:hypothetical protein